jgi:group I intron endonuclease
MANDVYLIINLVNNKKYVGITRNGYLVRFHQHLQESHTAYHNSILHKALAKYGDENFVVKLIETNVPDSQIKEKEKYYIKLYDTFYVNKKGYNMTEGGDGMSGYSHTKQTKAKISSTLTGHKFPKSRNKKIQQAMIGREYKEEWKLALSASRKGRFKGNDNPFYGKRHSNVTIQKLREAHSKCPVACCDIATQSELHTFIGFCDAARWVIASGLTTAQVKTCATRIRVVATSTNTLCTAYGYIWKLKEGQSTNCSVGDELPHEAQSSVDNTDKI